MYLLTQSGLMESKSIKKKRKEKSIHVDCINHLVALNWHVCKIAAVDVLQTLWGNWNKSTPNPSSNLAGWSSTQGKPCNSMFDDRSLVDNWRGVECLPLLNETASGDVDIRIIGL